MEKRIGMYRRRVSKKKENNKTRYLTDKTGRFWNKAYVFDVQTTVRKYRTDFAWNRLLNSEKWRSHGAVMTFLHVIILYKSHANAGRRRETSLTPYTTVDPIQKKKKIINMQNNDIRLQPITML